jgi:hypothetical protein
MMHPEMMHIIVAQMQAERRREAMEPLDMPFTDGIEKLRRGLGKMLISLGVLLGGRVPQVAPTSGAA